MHDDPDPDALTSGYLLSLIAKHFSVTSRIVYSGGINRSENKEMVTKFGLKVHPYKKKEEQKYDLLALVDTQPHKSNHALYQKKIPILFLTITTLCS